MILANGDVHACNMIEMAGEPPLGNINNSSLKEILYGDSKKVFDNNVHKMCKYCAMSNTILIEMT
jgi:radical SAM protein with 4Fe4S-binding SPASM domain